MPQHSSETPGDAGPRRRIDIELSEGLWRLFEENAAQDELTPGEAVVRALSAHLAIREGQREGALFLMPAPDGTVERLTFTDSSAEGGLDEAVSSGPTSRVPAPRPLLQERTGAGTRLVAGRRTPGGHRISLGDRTSREISDRGTLPHVPRF